MPPMVQLSDKEKLDVLRHLGYPVLANIPSTTMGFPGLGQPAFLVMLATQILEDSMVAQVRQYLAQLDGLNNQIMQATARLKAKKVGEIDLNPEELDRLDAEFYRWACILADLLGGFVNSYSARFKKYTQGVNVPVIH